MRRTIEVLLFPLVLVLAGVRVAAAQRPVRGSSAEVARVRALIERANALNSAAFVKGDCAAMSAFYTADAIVMSPNMPAMAGRDNLMAACKPDPSIRAWQLTTNDLELFGDTALERGTYQGTIGLPGTEPTPLRGKYVLEWKREQDGRWRIHMDIFNSDTPAAGEACPTRP